MLAFLHYEKNISICNKNIFFSFFTDYTEIVLGQQKLGNVPNPENNLGLVHLHVKKSDAVLIGPVAGEGNHYGISSYTFHPTILVLAACEQQH